MHGIRVVVVSIGAVGCASGALGDVTRWPDAEDAFRVDPQWRGGDVAASVPLDDGRVLWVFGDSFVGEADDDDSRAGQTLVRNSVAVQTGPDLVDDPLVFAWDRGGRMESPGAIFEIEGPNWLWPGPMATVDGGVLFGLSEVAPYDGGLGFEGVGGLARWVEDVSGAPEDWTAVDVPLPDGPGLLATGHWVWDGDHLLAFAPREPGDHDVWLARWARRDVRDQDLSTPSWWTGTGWSTDPYEAEIVAPEVQTEFTVHVDGDGTWWMVHVDGFGATNVAVRTAPAPQGPWSEPQTLFRPAESDRFGTFVYAARAHPHLTHPDGVVLTWASNHQDFGTLVGDLSLYTPHVGVWTR